jgi:hypothetical protein
VLGWDVWLLLLVLLVLGVFIMRRQAVCLFAPRTFHNKAVGSVDMLPLSLLMILLTPITCKSMGSMSTPALISCSLLGGWMGGVAASALLLLVVVAVLVCGAFHCQSTSRCKAPS